MQAAMSGVAFPNRGLVVFLSGLLLSLLFVSSPVDARPRPKTIATRQTEEAPCGGIFNSGCKWSCALVMGSRFSNCSTSRVFHGQIYIRLSGDGAVQQDQRFAISPVL